MIGKKILSYKVINQLGEGGMGHVYLAEHVTSGEKVAIKALLPQLIKHQSIRERFNNEADIMRLLPHPNIIKFIEYTEDADGAYIIMEYVEGTDLNKYIKNESGPLRPEKVLELIKQILEAFSFAHRHGVIHRDIKPSNIILTDQGQIKIIDFGIAKILSEVDKKLTKTGLQMGAVFYMSPEQVKGKHVDNRSDIYSLGITLFQMVSGQNPYEDLTTEYEVYHRIVHDPLPSIRSIYPAALLQFDAIIAKATQKEPANRYDNCADFLRALSAIDLSDDKDKKQKEDTGGGNAGDDVVKKKTNGVLIFSLVLLLIVLITGGWQCSVHSEYKKLISKAQQAYYSEDYLAASNYYTDAAERRKSLVFGRGGVNPEYMITTCNFEMYKKWGNERLRADSFSLSKSTDYKFTALEMYNTASTYRPGDNFINDRIKLCDLINTALENYRIQDYPQTADLYDKAIVLARQIGEEGPTIEHLEKAKNAISTPSATFTNIWIEHNVNENGQDGMKIHCKFDTKFLNGRTCNLTIWFTDIYGTYLTDTNNQYNTDSKSQVAVGEMFYPPAKSFTFQDFYLFMPYQELEIPSDGEYECYAGIFVDDVLLTKSWYVSLGYRTR